VCKRLEASAPEHPLTALLLPVVEKDPETVRASAGQAFEKIRRAPIGRKKVRTYAKLFLYWLELRLGALSLEELIMLFPAGTPTWEETNIFKELRAAADKRVKELEKERKTYEKERKALERRRAFAELEGRIAALEILREKELIREEDYRSEIAPVREELAALKRKRG